jgi:hypothetical protein
VKVILSEYQEKQIGKTLDLTGQSLYTGNTAVSYAHHRRWRRAFMRARFTPCVMMTRWRQSVVVYFSLADSEPMRNLDLVTVASRVQNGVVCLIPALAFHEVTTQIPHEVHVALQRGAEIPRLNYPPIKLCWFSDKAYSAGVETHKLDGVSERIYSPEKNACRLFQVSKQNRSRQGGGSGSVLPRTEKRQCGDSHALCGNMQGGKSHAALPGILTVHRFAKSDALQTTQL